MQDKDTKAIALDEDAELVKRSQRGELRAFDELITKYRSKIYAMIYNMVHSEQDAWDLAQEAFFKAWKSLARFRQEALFHTWLYRITMNVTLDWLRKIKPQTDYDETLGITGVEPGAVTIPLAEPAPHETLEREEIRQRIEDAIERLSPEHRAVILMREVEDMSYEEIAESLGCSIGTIMSRLFYARKKLQTSLEDLHENI